MNPSLECELTRVQMKRYLGGEELPEPLMEELEQHVHACASCRHYLDTQKLKLAAKLSGAKADKVKEPAEPKGPKDSEVFREPKQKLFTPKMMGLAAALALVLFAMSAVAKDPTILFGRKASTALTSPEKDKLTGDHAEGAPAEEEESSDSHKTEEDSSHGKVGEIMTGDSVMKEMREKEEAEAAKAEHDADPEKADSHGAAEGEGHASDSLHEPKKTAADSSDHGADVSHTEKPAEKPVEMAPAKPEAKHDPKPAVKKEPAMSLVVAEHGKTTKEAAPKPRPKVMPSAPAKTRVKRSAPKRRTPVRKSSPKRTSSARRQSSPKPSGSGSIKIYDSQGRPVN